MIFVILVASVSVKDSSNKIISNTTCTMSLNIGSNIGPNLVDHDIP